MLAKATIPRPQTSQQSGAQGAARFTWPWHAKLAVALILAIATTSVVFAVLHGFAYFDHARIYGLVQAAMVAGTLVLLGGLWTMQSKPLLGALQVLVPGLALAVMWAFLPPMSVAVLIVTVYGLCRAYVVGREQRRQSAAQQDNGGR